jgi:hypothetical protein
MTIDSMKTKGEKHDACTLTNEKVLIVSSIESLDSAELFTP